MTHGDNLVPEQPVSKQIEPILYRDIVECRIPPGTILSENNVALRFGISRQPVREVFIRLAENRLIQVLPQRGSYVTRISLHQVREVAFIRQAIECVLVSELTERGIDADTCFRLEENLRQQQITISSGNIGDFLIFDDRFHELLAEATGCGFAWPTIANIKPAIDRVRFLSLRSLTSPVVLWEQHYKIYQAIYRQDHRAAEAIMYNHLDDITPSVQKIYQRCPDWFSVS